MAPLTGRDFVRFLFDNIEEEVLASLRQDVPKFSETDRNDPLVQFARFVAYNGHRLTSLIDLVASEMSWPTLQRRRSAVALATLVGQKLLPASPGATDVLLDLIGAPAPADVVLVDQALCRTGGDVDNPAVIYEAQTPGDVAVGNLEFTLIAEEAGVFSSPVISVLPTPWATPAVGDAVYFGHAALTWDAIQLVGAGVPSGYSTHLEYYDGHFRTRRPDSSSITIGTASISFGVDDLIGSPVAPSYNAASLAIRVTLNATGQFQDVTSTYPGSGNVATVNGFLGQSSPSTDPNDYTISAPWLPLVVVAGTSGAAILEFIPTGTPYTRDAEFAHPSDIQPNGAAADRKWQTTTINGVLAYWLRERITTASTPVGPTQVVALPSDLQTWTLQIAVIQGQTVEDVLGTTSGVNFEEFDLNETPFVGGSFSELAIGTDIEWTLADELLTSGPEDKVFILLERPDGTRYIAFGDGVNGRVPPASQTVVATYRIDSVDNGNVGVGQIDNVESGANYLSNARNPRVANGWKEQEGDTTASLLRVKRLVPAGVRTSRKVAVTSEDVEYLATQVFLTADGRSPFARVAVVERGAGFKTLLAVCVGAGGTVPAASDVKELQDFFNGFLVGFQRFGGVALANQQIICRQYVPVDFTITGVLTVSKRYAVTAEATAKAALLAAASPLSVNSVGIYRHFPGSSLTDSFFLSILGGADIDGLVQAVVTGSPSLPYTLGKDALPRAGAPDAPIIPLVTIVEV